MTGFSQTFVGKLVSKVYILMTAFFSPLITLIVESGGTVLLEIVEDAVKAAEATGGTSAEKLEAAKATILEELESKGLPVVWTAINGAIEAAVAAMKAED